jgi:DNA-directed RNA polymerase specialized sigma24 family protein
MDDRDAQARIDRNLVEQALRTGDARVFGLLVRRHQGKVRAQLRRLLGDDPELADDLAQETFVLAWRKLEQYRGESRFSTWLYRIAHSCFQQHWRSKGWRAQQESDLESSDHVSTNQRVALMYCVQLELTHEEAAVVLDMPLGSVKTHVARGKAKLRQLLQDWAPESGASTGEQTR